jgi:hypothetical protein
MVALIFPDAYFSAWKGISESEEAVLFLVQRFCEAYKALFMWESKRLLLYSAQYRNLRESVPFHLDFGAAQNRVDGVRNDCWCVDLNLHWILTAVPCFAAEDVSQHHLLLTHLNDCSPQR